MIESTQIHTLKLQGVTAYTFDNGRVSGSAVNTDVVITMKEARQSYDAIRQWIKDVRSVQKLVDGPVVGKQDRHVIVDDTSATLKMQVGDAKLDASVLKSTGIITFKRRRQFDIGWNEFVYYMTSIELFFNTVKFELGV